MAIPRILQMLKSVLVNNVVLTGNFTIGSSGAVSSQTPVAECGFTVTQTGSEDGRYGIAFQRTWGDIKAAHVTMIGPADNAFPTTTGSDPQARLLAASGFSVQFKRPDTQADADPASGTVCCVTAVVTK